MHIFKKEDPEIAAKIKAATSIRMDDAAREKTRALLSEYVKMRPIRVTEPAPDTTPAHSNASGFFMRHSIPAFVAVLVVVVGGTAAAAEGALPGDILYPIKVHVNEEMRATLATSPKAKADWAVGRAERRLEEAATLALSGELNEITRAEIETNLDAHVKSAGESGQKLEDENDVPDARDVKAKIGAIKVARENILEGVRAVKAITRTGAAADTANTAMMMSARFEVKAIAEDVNEKDADQLETVTRGHRTAAKARIEATKRFLDRSPKQLATSTRAQAETRLKAAAEELSSGDAEVARGNKEEASSNFDAALETATQIEALISVSSDTNERESEVESKIELGL